MSDRHKKPTYVHANRGGSMSHVRYEREQQIHREGYEKSSGPLRERSCAVRMEERCETHDASTEVTRH